MAQLPVDKPMTREDMLLGVVIAEATNDPAMVATLGGVRDLMAAAAEINR